MLIDDTFINFEEVDVIAGDQFADLVCDFLMDLLLEGTSFGVIELGSIMLAHDFVSGDHFSVLQLLENQIVDFFQSGFVHTNNPAQDLHFTL